MAATHEAYEFADLHLCDHKRIKLFAAAFSEKRYDMRNLVLLVLSGVGEGNVGENTVDGIPLHP